MKHQSSIESMNTSDTNTNENRYFHVWFLFCVKKKKINGKNNVKLVGFYDGQGIG